MKQLPPLYRQLLQFDWHLTFNPYPVIYSTDRYCTWNYTLFP